MKIEFKPDDTLCIIPESSTEVMALKYWKDEYEKHGEKVLHVSTDLPIQLAHNKG